MKKISALYDQKNETYNNILVLEGVALYPPKLMNDCYKLFIQKKKT